MSGESPYDKGERLGLGRPEVRILYCVAAWFSGYTFNIHNKRLNIGTAFEPTLRQLCEAADLWEQGYEQVHESMKDRGLFKSTERGENVYLAGRRCEWIPTHNCLKIIETIFQEEERLYAPWATHEHTRPPTFRDGNELMEHRKGVMVAAKSFQDYTAVEGLSVEYYPRVNVPQRPDLRIYGTQAKPLARIEVLTNHGNTDTWETKFSAWNNPKDWTTIWLFENREGMVRFWNHLVRHGFIELDGGLFTSPVQNWPPIRVNDRLLRSRNGRQNYSSKDACWTIPGLLQADMVNLHEWVKDYNIFK